MGDIYGDHAVSCACIVGIKHRHNVVRDTLVDICYRSGISSGKEVDIGLEGGRDKSLRPADVLLYSWDCGRDVCVDLTGSLPLTQIKMVDFVPSHAVLEAAHRKRVKYEAKCVDIGYGFLPFSFSSLESLGRMREDHTSDWLRVVLISSLVQLAQGFLTGMIMETMLNCVPVLLVLNNVIVLCAIPLSTYVIVWGFQLDIGARAAVHIFNRIGFAIAKKDGAGNELTKILLITHLRDRHCNGDAQAITKQSLSTNLAVFDEAEVTFKRMGGSLQVMRETLAESFIPLSNVDEEDINLGLSSSGVDPYNDVTLEELKTKHPFNPLPPLPHISIDHRHLIASSAVVLDRIKSFPHGTSCGRDGLRAQHLMNCLGGAAVAISEELVSSITQVVNLFLDDKCPNMLGEYIASAPLTPLVKPDGGICPIVVGTVWRCLVSKVSAIMIGHSLDSYLDGLQFGVGVAGGSEAILHSVNHLIEACEDDIGLSMLLVDFKNAFNLVDREAILYHAHMPPRVFESAQRSFDVALRSSLERIVTACGPGFGDWKWRLATLPFKFGGLVFIMRVMLCLSYFSITVCWLVD
nr:hypothetical protein [Tanacetum cinerariifolium]